MSARAVHKRVDKVTAKGERSGPGTMCNSGESRAERPGDGCSRGEVCDEIAIRLRSLRFPVFEQVQWESIRRSGGKGARLSDRGPVQLFLGS